MRLKIPSKINYLLFSLLFSSTSPIKADYLEENVSPGHATMQEWLLPKTPPHPEDNKPTAARIELGKMLFFDKRLSGNGDMSCATCHNPVLGWSDGLPTAKGFNDEVLERASPTVINSAYNSIQMWDGRNKSLEEQALGPITSKTEMNMEIAKLINWLNGNQNYVNAFQKAYPNREINIQTVAMAIASFERTIISNNSAFDFWVKGDKKAMTKQQVQGFKVFLDPNKGNCAACHLAPNFTDDGFHNIGLQSFAEENPDLGRYEQKPVKLMKGAFKTPTLRNIALTAPYFHDGSAKNLEEVIDHYIEGGITKSNLSPNMKTLSINDEEKQALIAFLQALTTKQESIALPHLPEDHVIDKNTTMHSSITNNIKKGK